MIKEFCGECGREHPRKRWETFCDACGVLTARGAFNEDTDDESETLHEKVAVRVGHKQFLICIDCVAKISSKFTADLMVAARGCSDFKLAEELERKL